MRLIFSFSIEFAMQYADLNIIGSKQRLTDIVCCLFLFVCVCGFFLFVWFLFKLPSFSQQSFAHSINANRFCDLF